MQGTRWTEMCRFCVCLTLQTMHAYAAVLGRVRRLVACGSRASYVLGSRTTAVLLSNLLLLMGRQTAECKPWITCSKARVAGILTHLEGDDLVLDVAQDVAVEADVVLEHVHAALQEDALLESAHEIVHHVLRRGKRRPDEVPSAVEAVQHWHAASCAVCLQAAVCEHTSGLKCYNESSSDKQLTALANLIKK